MSRTRRARDLLVMSARWALILAKSVLIVLMLQLLASHFHLRLFREAGGQTGGQAQAARFTGRRA
ncbi:MAG: hypothetical protein ABJA98_17810 [Acidobacteriota bacterium]